MTKIKLNSLAQTLIKNASDGASLIDGYPIRQSNGNIEIATDLMGATILNVNEKDILHHLDGDGETAPSTFIVRANAAITITTTTTSTAEQLQAGPVKSQCECGSASQDHTDGGFGDAESLMRLQQQSSPRGDAIRGARCLGAYIGCSFGCFNHPYPDLCRSICSNSYSRCRTPIWM